MRDDELYMELDDDLRVPLRYKGTKCIFDSRVPTRQELNECTRFDVTGSDEWDPESVNFTKMRRMSQLSRLPRTVYMTIAGTQASPSLSSVSWDEKYAYVDLSSDKALLSDVLPSLVKMKELSMAQLIVTVHDNEIFPARRSFVSRKRHADLAADSLWELWGIGPKRARATLLATTQMGICSAILPLTRRYRADRMYNIKRLDGKFATDTFYADMKSIHGNTCCQVYSHKVGFQACYPKINATGNSLGETLDDFVHDFCAPSHLTFDGHQSQVGKKTCFFKSLQKYRIDHHVWAPRRPNENPAEGTICELKRRFYTTMTRRGVPKRLWDYLIVWICETYNLSVSSSCYTNGRTPIEIITRTLPISVNTSILVSMTGFCTEQMLA